MASKTKHTHTGTCQACGAKQAVDNNTRKMAKHGYKVAGFGFFAGTCPGSDKKPAELDITFTHHIIMQMGEIAAECDRLAPLYASRDLWVITRSVRTGYKDSRGFAKYHDVTMFGCPDYIVDEQQKRAAYAEESQARQARSHAESLLKHVIPRFGRALYVAKHVVPKKFATGDTVTLHDGVTKAVLSTPVYGFHQQSTPRGYLYIIEGVASGKMWVSMRDLRKHNS